MTTDPLIDRARGALLGLAAGDAVGTTLEFTRRDSSEPLTDMVGGGPFGLVPGQWTDDTSMALALADSLVNTADFDARDLMQRFVRWYRAGDYSATGTCFDIGNVTRGALHRFEREHDPMAGPTAENTAGNGSLMRLSPVAIWGTHRDRIRMREIAREQSAATHGAPACVDACEAMAVLLHALIRGSDLPHAIAAAHTVTAVEPIATVLGGSWKTKERHEIESSGYVAHSLEAALWCVGQTDDFRGAILMAANLGDDADTTAAIAGQIAGALYGESGIPDEWLDKLAWREQITVWADQLVGAAPSH